jgi:hypothetical protein
MGDAPMTRVRALRQGYYNDRLWEPGEEFEVARREDIGRWMEVLDPPRPEPPPARPRAQGRARGSDVSDLL